MRDEKDGFFLVYDKVFENSTVKPRKPFDRFAAWVWMLKEACRAKEGRKVLRPIGSGQTVVEEGYGQFCHSQRFMAKAWGWTRKKTETFLSHLEIDGAITRNQSQYLSQITICNFGDYQNRGASKDTKTEPKRSQNGAKTEPNYNTKTRKHENTKATTSSRRQDDAPTHPLQIHIRDNCPRVNRMDKRLTADEAAKILDHMTSLALTRDDVKEVLADMENHKPLLKRYTSAYRTLRNWMNTHAEKKARNGGTRRSQAEIDRINEEKAMRLFDKKETGS